MDARDRASLDSESQRLLAVEDFYNTQLDLAIDNAELTKQIEEQQDAELAELQKTFIKERKERADAARKAESDAQKEADDKELDDAQKLADAKAQMQSMVLTAGFDLARMFAAADADATKKEQKKAFQNSKKIAVAETLINTYFAAQQAYSSQFIPGVPDPSAPDPWSHCRPLLPWPPAWLRSFAITRTVSTAEEEEQQTQAVEERRRLHLHHKRT